MPVHDWTTVDAGTFYAFRLAWIGEMQKALNGGVLPKGFYAMAEQHAGETIPDVLALHTSDPDAGPLPEPTGSVATITKTRPKVDSRLTASASPKGKRRTIAIRHVSGHRVVALVEIVSPANKDRKSHVSAFVNKMVAALQLGIHVLLIDLFPPGKHDPNGMHGAVWDRFDPDEDGAPPEDQPFALAAYTGGNPAKAYVSFVAVGDTLPAVPLFLTPERFVNLELELGYTEAYAGMPEFWHNVIEKRSA
jgi:hypothetical protein